MRGNLNIKNINATCALMNSFINVMSSFLSCFSRFRLKNNKYRINCDIFKFVRKDLINFRNFYFATQEIMKFFTWKQNVIKLHE